MGYEANMELEAQVNSEKTTKEIDPEERLAFLQSKGYGDGDISSWGWTDGQHKREWIRRACFAQVTYMQGEQGGIPCPTKGPVTFYSGSYSQNPEIELPWIQFILSPTSPWWPVLDNLTFNDPERNLKMGYIFKDFRSLDARCFYSFLMATRFPGEHPAAAKRWLQLIAQGHDPRDAFIFGQSFNRFSGAWRLVGGGLHSFISSYPLWFAGRFGTSDPQLGTTMKSDFRSCTPNQEMWLPKDTFLVNYVNMYPKQVAPPELKLSDDNRHSTGYPYEETCWDIYRQVKDYQLKLMSGK